MKQTFIRLLLMVLFLLLFAFVIKTRYDIVLLAFVCTYVFEGIVSQLTNK